MDPAKRESLTEDGVVEEVLPNATYLIRLANHHHVLAQLSGKLRKRITVPREGDSVRVELSPHDMTKGRLV